MRLLPSYICLSTDFEFDISQIFFITTHVDDFADVDHFFLRSFSFSLFSLFLDVFIFFSYKAKKLFMATIIFVHFFFGDGSNAHIIFLLRFTTTSWYYDFPCDIFVHASCFLFYKFCSRL